MLVRNPVCSAVAVAFLVLGASGLAFARGGGGGGGRGAAGAGGGFGGAHMGMATPFAGSHMGSATVGGGSARIGGVGGNGGPVGANYGVFGFTPIGVHGTYGAPFGSSGVSTAPLGPALGAAVMDVDADTAPSQSSVGLPALPRIGPFWIDPNSFTSRFVYPVAAGNVGGPVSFGVITTPERRQFLGGRQARALLIHRTNSVFRTGNSPFLNRHGEVNEKPEKNAPAADRRRVKDVTYETADLGIPKLTTSSDNARVFAEKGETDFRTANYSGAVYAWRHATLDDPQNGRLRMMLGQGFFAAGQYREATGAVQRAMDLLPPAEWGILVQNFSALYPKGDAYAKQLRLLESAVKAHGEDPKTRFLLAFHYGFLGHPGKAIDQLSEATRLAPDDRWVKQLDELLKSRLRPPAADQRQEERDGI